IFPWANMSHKKPFLGSNMWNWYRFDAQKDQYLMESWQIGNKMREDCWNPRYQLCVNDAYSSNPYNAQAGSQSKQPIDGDLVLKIILKHFKCAIVPEVHYNEKDES